ncbi:hypothetical protein GVN20_26905 [Runella sp. CRIBMP]|nr:hypothetical protein [Runella sp. CRIBMP]NBB23014.1 hypothetical protein [Runella sp. CRIBMP]
MMPANEIPPAFFQKDKVLINPAGIDLTDCLLHNGVYALSAQKSQSVSC